ncbi:MAG: hypothetical protein II062_06870 [Oscillospiraceae bacterium]|nr:hypothetical protein [Oscillospiraceae bacterium]MBR7010159.1 hypothetical protein [Oscillospiraceae bacterium]
MKHGKLLALLLCLLLTALLLAACGSLTSPAETVNPAVRAAAGTYVGQYTKLVGSETKNEEVFSLTLKEDGTGVHARNDMEFKVTWTLEGESFSMKETFIGDPILYTGTLKDGVLDIVNGDPDTPFTYNYVYKKQ